MHSQIIAMNVRAIITNIVIVKQTKNGDILNTDRIGAR